MLLDSALTLEIPGQGIWAPKNYEADFQGPVTMRASLYQSLNLSTIRLGMAITEEAVIAEARRFGISTPIPAVPSIHIGSADVYPIEIISAYTAFANLGARTRPTAILRVEDRQGNILWEPPVRSDFVMSPEQAWLMTSVLQDVVRVGTASGRVGRYFAGLPVGGKTGTTNDGKDVWFIGFTPELVTGVWIGFDQPQKIMANAQGGRLAAPAWTTYMRELYDRRPAPGSWPRPETLAFAEIDKTTGYKATPFCPLDVHAVESFVAGTEPAFCPVHSPFGVMGGPAVPGQSMPGAMPSVLPGAVPAAPAGAGQPAAVQTPRPQH
jgi:penicillin-binding protein 1A